MNLRTTLPIAFALTDHVRRAAAASALLRGLLLVMLGAGVTTGGVLAGALVVAPVVAQLSRSGANTQVVLAPSIAAPSLQSSVKATLASARAARASLIASLPTQFTRYAPPILALVSIGGALTAVLTRRDLQPIRAPGRIAPNRHRTPRAVEALAATGASTADIAWRTGLPIDAVQLLLAISSAPRQLQPPTA